MRRAIPLLVLLVSGRAVAGEVPDERLVYDRSSNTVKAGDPLEPLGRVELYRRVDRPDLATEQEDRYRRRTWFLVSAPIVTVVLSGAGVLIYALTFSLAPTASSAGPTAGAVLVIAGPVCGLLLLTVGLLEGRSVTSADEDEKLVTDYNQRLLQRLSRPATSDQPPAAVPTLRVAVARGGVQLQLGWSF